MRQATAPVLMIPNILSPKTCQALIGDFEASAHRPGRMAGLKDGQPIAKIDEVKKRRRDVELTADNPVHADVVALFANRCAPEIKRAFQAEISFADRILLARYDDTGGYFRRHRDNVAPQTAFREFAISVNLNTDEYEGGELLFPEYDDHRYNPPAGGALIFSASLLHEAAPVTRGRRYVLLVIPLHGGGPGARGRRRLGSACAAFQSRPRRFADSHRRVPCVKFPQMGEARPPSTVKWYIAANVSSSAHAANWP